MEQERDGTRERWSKKEMEQERDGTGERWNRREMEQERWSKGEMEEKCIYTFHISARSIL